MGGKYMIIDICEKSGCDKSTPANTFMKKTNIKEKINMENYKSSPQVWLEKQDFEDKSFLLTIKQPVGKSGAIVE